MSSHTIRFVDDAPGVLDITVTTLRYSGFEVVEADGPDAAMAALQERSPRASSRP